MCVLYNVHLHTLNTVMCYSSPWVPEVLGHLVHLYLLGVQWGHDHQGDQEVQYHPVNNDKAYQIEHMNCILPITKHFMV